MAEKNASKLKEFLDSKVQQYERPSFIKDDPICIPHLFSTRQDIEIAGFFAATFAWGNRTTIIQKSKQLMQMMDMQPYAFCVHHQPSDLRALLNFKHRTFNSTDLLYFISFFQYHYTRHQSLEEAFFPAMPLEKEPLQQALIRFHHYFFSLPHVPPRSRKHVATPEKKSNCKRLNMFLRWMVRSHQHGVDFGIWKRLQPAQLICPIDLHVARVAKRFGLLERKIVDWQSALELTRYLRTLDPLDPVKYDFALFGLGVIEKY